jgi:hypothetical protein
MQNTDHDQSMSKTTTPLEPNVSESSSTSTKVIVVEQKHKVESNDDFSSARIFSSHKSDMDYVTLQGIENMTGLTKTMCMVLS